MSDRVPAEVRRARLGWRDTIALNLRATRARTYVRVVGSLREPAWIVSDAVFPSLGMCAFVLLYRGLGAPRSFEALAVLGARVGYGLPYHRARMTVREGARHVEYRSARPGAIVSVRVRVGDRLESPDALARFLIERYRLYARHLGRLLTAAVAHEPWPLHHAWIEACDQTLTRWAGLTADGPHDLVHYSPGVHTRIGAPRSVAARLRAHPAGEDSPLA